MQHPSSDVLTRNFEFIGHKLLKFLLVGGVEVFEKAHGGCRRFLCSFSSVDLSSKHQFFIYENQRRKESKSDIFGWVHGKWYRNYYHGHKNANTSMPGAADRQPGVKSSDPETYRDPNFGVLFQLFRAAGVKRSKKILSLARLQNSRNRQTDRQKDRQKVLLLTQSELSVPIHFKVTEDTKEHIVVW
jgi:hypothetical protein